MERFDVCIICALAEEAEAFIKVVEQKPEVRFERKHSNLQQRDYFHTTILNARGEPLSLLVTWQARMGMLDTGSTFAKLLQEFETRFVAMTGICAGNKKHVKMGDLIVAEKTFIYDGGSRIINASGQKEQLHNTITFQTQNDILQITRLFNEWNNAVEQYKEQRPISKFQQRDWLLNELFEKQTTVYGLDKKELRTCAPDWKTILEELQVGEHPLINKETRGLSDRVAFERYIFDLDDFPYQDTTKPECYIGALASGNAVRRDDPFEEIEQVDSKILGVDMEGTAIYYALQDHRDIRSLVVKGVSDYADGNKDDRYHTYAATLSAAYITTFITQFVNDEYMPWPDGPQKATNNHQTQSSTKTSPQSPQTQTTQITGTTKPPVKIFISHSQSEEDQKLIEALTGNLTVLKRGKQPLIEDWNRHDIEAGDTQDEEIKKKLDEAQIILLMISPDYYKSSFYHDEIEQVEQRHLKGARVIPILLRPTDDYWKEAFSYGALRPLPNDDRAITQWRNRDEAMTEITKAIRKAVEKLQNP